MLSGRFPRRFTILSNLQLHLEDCKNMKMRSVSSISIVSLKNFKNQDNHLPTSRVILWKNKKNWNFKNVLCSLYLN